MPFPGGDRHMNSNHCGTVRFGFWSTRSQIMYCRQDISYVLWEKKYNAKIIHFFCYCKRDRML